MTVYRTHARLADRTDSEKLLVNGYRLITMRMKKSEMVLTQVCRRNSKVIGEIMADGKFHPVRHGFGRINLAYDPLTTPEKDAK